MQEPSSPNAWCDLLLAARRNRQPIDSLAGGPALSHLRDAYEVQRLTIDALGGHIGGWKVGAKSPEDSPQYSPLPASCLFDSGASLRRGNYQFVGLELEVAFEFRDAFVSSHGPYAPEAILDKIANVAATIEIVDSRFRHWPNVDRLLQLADMQNHGALIAGSRKKYDPAIQLTNPRAHFECGGHTIFSGPATNPAGDPRHLLVWLVNWCVQNNLRVAPDTVITTGSYTGMYRVDGTVAAEVNGEIEGVGSVSFTLA
jgi:2-keto-4-pentenoate hydratase